MRKIIYMLIIMVSISMFAVFFTDKNENDRSHLANLVSVDIEGLTHREACSIGTTVENKEAIQTFIDKLLKLAKDNHYILTGVYYLNKDETSVAYTYYVYDQENIIYDHLVDYYIDYRNNDYQKNNLSTETDLQLMNNFSISNHDSYEFKSFDSYVDEVQTVNDFVFLYL